MEKIFNETERALRPAKIPIGKSAAEIYQFIRNPKNLKFFVVNLQEVKELKPGIWKWTFNRNGRLKVLQSEIIVDRENELLVWRTISPQKIGDIGAIEIRDDPSGRGSIVTMKLGKYEKNPGKMAGVVSQLMFGGDAKSQSFINLRRLKSYLETGEVPTTYGQPSGREPSEEMERKSS